METNATRESWGWLGRWARWIGAWFQKPTTTAVVFFETEPGDLPPRPVMAASASSRV